MAPMPTRSPGAPIRWDVVEDHLDEAAFLHAQWERALADPEYTLAEVAAGPEERLLAHLDGLVVAGAPAAGRLLLPALAGPDPDAAFAAAWALLASEDGDFTAPVLDALAGAEPELVAAAARALMLSPRPDVLAPLATLVARGSPLTQAAALDVLAHRRAEPGARLDPLLAAGEPAVRRAALRLVRHLPGRVGSQSVNLSLRSEDPGERDLAIAVGLEWGVRAAWARCEEVVRAGGPGWAFPALAWALAGEPDLAPLLAGLRDEARRGAALVALGYSGRAAAAEAALPWLEDEELSPLAAEALSAVTGLPIAEEYAAEPERWDPDAEVEEDGALERSGPEADLPRPEASTVAAWWESARGRFDPAARYLGGQPWSGDALVHALRAGPMRRREALAFDLAVRTRGGVQLETSAWARDQLEAQARLGAGAPRIARGTYAEPASSRAVD